MPKRKTEKIIIIVGTVFLLCGLLSLFNFVNSIRKNACIKNNYTQTQAVITGFEPYTYRDKNGSHTSYRVNIEYTVNGRSYNSQLGYYTAGMVEGDEVPVYYDPADPSVHKQPSTADVIGFLIFGTAFCGAGAFALNYEISDYLKVNNIINSGKYVICSDWEEAKSSVRVNKKRYNCIKCTYTAENGRKYYFTSIAFHPGKSPAANLVNGVKVYVDLDGDATVYYVSLEETV